VKLGGAGNVIGAAVRGPAPARSMGFSTDTGAGAAGSGVRSMATNTTPTAIRAMAARARTGLQTAGLRGRADLTRRAKAARSASVNGSGTVAKNLPVISDIIPGTQSVRSIQSRPRKELK